ncbi:MAG: Inosose isomerase [uncultured Gemmatimonadaceae bacterium]|uniref:Inosose isomerase n=1 Tax=uncultured Gemmatimonadaceae bacterium TaxID=246130 RepID=A0A6J4KEB4_9BACT|nr:MAG: Inosose isomerase [uncultured Gemmatimonadaceae bacterium]
MRPVTLFTGQWADLPLDTLAAKAATWGYDGLELACWGDHFDVARALAEDDYCQGRRDLLARHGLAVHAISNHLVGQAVCDPIDERHRSILPPAVWGDGEPEGVRARAARAMQDTARAAARLGVGVVNGFTGSSIWHLLYSFPPVPPETIDAGYADLARRWRPILDSFAEAGVRFALEVHPTEIAFDISSAERTLAALGGHPAFGFNFDPSHLAYQNVDYVAFVDRFADRIYHAHMKDVWWAAAPGRSGVFGGHLPFGHPERGWEFRSLGRGRVDFEAVARALNRGGYAGPLSVEWEDAGMEREHGAREACAFVRRLDFPTSAAAFDAAFARK